ncbi:hypothetical protein GCM10022408_33220 [Hymenobacter fastidiosus]|uniref:DUF6311 domain-containing protein n=1 Tax=Hymenobacter fastidiosus TaxID=486264 RepID=A0ABP7SV72_9BACT
MILLRRNAHWLGLLIVALASAGLLVAFFGPVLANPDDYFFQAGGDGIQSYFATAYYALYDSGQHFSGMNYPFGENVNYPNLQPLIAWSIAGLQHLGIPAAKHTIGITNLLALLSLWATPPVLYAILRRLGLAIWYAVLTALIIGFLSPQVQRLGGHMSLSYACFMPLLWYFIIRMQEAPQQWRWYVLFGVSSLLMGAVMLYFLACGCFLLLAHAVVLFFQRPRPLALLWRMTLTALLPLLLFRGWLWATDPITDRPPNPFGFLVYMATPGGVFTPALAPLRPLWAGLFHTKDISFEASSYIGLVCTGVLAVAGLRLVWQWGKRRRQRRGLGQGVPASLYTGMWAAALLLLFSLGLPFILPGLEGLLDYTGPLKQFRALGRFAWPFYYACSVFVAYYLYRLARYQRQRGIPLRALPWIPLLLIIWGAEAWINISTKAAEVAQGYGARAFMDPGTSLAPQLSWAGRRPSDFQAILPLPYMNKGTDKIDLSGSANSVFQAHKLALATGLPELATYVSRPSVEQMLRHVQLLSSPLVEKPLLNDFPSRKPILLLVTPDVLTPEEQRLVSISRLLVSSPEAKLYELPLAALGATGLARERAKARVLLPQLAVRPGGLYATTPKGVVRESFGQSPDRRGRLAAGAFHEPKEQWSVLYRGPVPPPADTGRYEVSVWINAKTDYGTGGLQVRQYRQQEVVDEQNADGRLSMEIDGDWFRMVVPVRVRPGVTGLEVRYYNRDLLADDLLIRPADTDVYWLDTRRQPVLNGYPLGR